MNHRLLGALLLIPALTLANPAFAADDKHRGMGGGHHDMVAAKGQHGDMDKGGHAAGKHKGGHKKKKGHNMSPHWAKTLSDEQRVAIDKMHLKLSSLHVVLKARAGLLQKELNVMTAKDGADKNAIDAKIDELMTVKAEIMKHRYDHLTEMRDALTEQQRISYDMAILKREGAK